MAEVVATRPVENVTASKTADGPEQTRSIGQRAKAMLERIWAKTRRQNPNPDAALAEVATFPLQELQDKSKDQSNPPSLVPAKAEMDSQHDNTLILDSLDYPGKANKKHEPTTSPSIGGVLARLRNEELAGVNLEHDPKRTKVYSSIEDAVPGIDQALSNGVVSHNEPAKKMAFDTGGHSEFVYDEVKEDLIYTDAYDKVVDFHKRNYGDKADVSLVRLNDDLVTVTSHYAGPRLRVIQILDAGYPYTERYQEAYNRAKAENRQPPNELGFFGGIKKSYIPARHLLLQDTQTGKVVDIRALIPKDWELRYYPQIGLANTAQDSDIKFVSYNEIDSPQKFLVLAHEIGHSVIDANNPELFRQTKEATINLRFTIGGANGLPQNEREDIKALMVRNERGASAHAYQLIRMFKEQGFDTGATPDEYKKIVDYALASYEAQNPGVGTENITFIHGQRKVPKVQTDMIQ